ncbi:MAG TPA: T9SS type A sorting domain-containing protein, partial [bacterium]|nr:T9SS type A sorting domain-containing protein [bacterium]
NPFIPSKNDKHGVPYSPGDRRSGIIFEGINYGTKIEIYTLKGQLVKKFINTNPEKFEWQWDTRNNSGTEVASGWYLYLVNKNGNKFTGKLAIIR